jgi:PAS domain S-box-containing protein
MTAPPATTDLYHSLVDNLPVCVIRKDRDGRFVFVNELFCQLLGRRCGDVIGRTDSDFYPLALAEKYRRDDEQVMRTGGVFASIEEHVAADGTRLHVEVRKTPVRSATGDIVGTQTIFWDVTDRITAEREREQMQARLLQSERLAAIGQMVAGVAHESRNALQQIQACTQLLNWQLGSDEEGRRLVADIQQAQDRLHRLFEELRSYASPMKPDRKPHDVRRIVQQAWNSMACTCNGRRVSLTESPADIDTHCPVDAFQLEQVFRNLLENSLAACDDPAQISVHYSRPPYRGGSALQVAVRDNGPGIAGDDAGRIFEPFYTTKTHGTGLGMAIARRIIEAHDGDIRVTRSEQPGAEIVITLPGSEP